MKLCSGHSQCTTNPSLDLIWFHSQNPNSRPKYINNDRHADDTDDISLDIT